jgi:MFS family permease
VTYVLAELPASLYVKRLQFNRVIPLITLGWGIICLCMGFIQNFAGLAVCRILLGWFEGYVLGVVGKESANLSFSCLFPSMTLLLANWYRREELAQRISYLFSAFLFISSKASPILT